MIFQKKFLTGSIAFALLGASATSWAQDEEETRTPPQISGIEEVVVTGIRSSLRDAIGIKRSYVGNVDAISAEDFGKFPDGNLAESLARVPGIAIDRSNVEGEKIAVRGFGPEFNMVTLNGRQMPTAPGIYEGGRAFNFGDIASPGVSAVEVFKSANSTLPSGGIGATVNMVTTKPLNVNGTLRSFSLSGVADTTSEAGGLPLESNFLYATNQDRWGFSFSGSFQERQNRETGTRENNWITVSEQPGRVDPLNPAFTNNNQRPDGETFYQEPSSYLIKDNDRTRINAQATFQYELTPDLVGTVDYTYSNVDFSSEGMLFGSWLGGWTTNEAIINEDGVFTDVVVGDRSYDHDVTWQDLVNTNKSVGLNLEWTVNDALTLEFDTHSSSAEVDGGELDNSIAASPNFQTNINHTNGGASGINTFTYDAEFLPEHYLLSGATIRDGFKENVMDQFQISGDWINLDGGLVTSVNFGVSHLESTFNKLTYEQTYATMGASAADYDDSLFPRTTLGSDFMNSFNPDIGTEYYYHIDPQDAEAAFRLVNATGALTAGDLDTNYQVNETQDAAFVQINMESEVSGMPIDMVLGFRYEDAETEAVSFFAPTTALRWDMIDGVIPVQSAAANISESGSNSQFLPSFALSVGITDEKVVRASVSKTMSRPDIFALSSRFDLSNRDSFQVTADAGNPSLTPVESTNFDISFENYYGDESYWAVNYFRKDISGFVGSRTVTTEVGDLRNPAYGTIGQYAQDCVNEWIDAGSPDPGFPGDPGATGHCVSQQALWAQPWMDQFNHMGWVALGITAGADVSAGYPWSDGAADDALCNADGWWRCEPGYIDQQASDPLAQVEVTRPYNMNSGVVDGIELAWQHLWEDTPYGMQFNYTYINGGDVDVDRYVIGEQFVLPGLGDSGNLSFFYEDDIHTLRLALGHRAETVAGFANYDQPLFLAARSQFDISYQYRYGDATTFFFDAANITDEESRLFVREEEMLFLAQDHGPVYKFGVRTSF